MSAVTPRVERKQGVSMLPQDRGVVVVLLAKERRKSRESTIEQPSCEKEKRGERQSFDFQPIGDSPLRRNNKTATRRECTINVC